MPVTMLQVLLFLFATLAIGDPGGWIEWAAIAFPFTIAPKTGAVEMETLEEVLR